LTRFLHSGRNAERYRADPPCPQDADIVARIIDNPACAPRHPRAPSRPRDASMSGLSIRSASLADAQAIADFHVNVWRHTYRDLAPAQAHAVLDAHYRGRKWREKLASNDGDQLVLVAEIDGTIVGIGAAGAPSEPIFGGRGEIKFLYVDPGFKRRGIGRTLLARLATHLQKMRYRGAALSVVKGNDAAIAFYASLDGRLAGEYVDPGPIWRSHNIVMVWDDLASLAT
jgi:ribosomal protein S18 acetylase RimI-like enzyme